MFASRFAVKSISRVAQRQFSGAAFKEKTLKQAWMEDTGAYPVMGVIVIAVLFSGGAGMWFMTTSPDCRISKTKRKSSYRADMLGADNVVVESDGHDHH